MQDRRAISPPHCPPATTACLQAEIQHLRLACGTPIICPSQLYPALSLFPQQEEFLLQSWDFSVTASFIEIPLLFLCLANFILRIQVRGHFFWEILLNLPCCSRLQATWARGPLPALQSLCPSFHNNAPPLSPPECESEEWADHTAGDTRVWRAGHVPPAGSFSHRGQRPEDVGHPGGIAWEEKHVDPIVLASCGRHPTTPLGSRDAGRYTVAPGGRASHPCPNR